MSNLGMDRDDKAIRHRESMNEQHVICTIVIAFLSGGWIDVIEFSSDDSG